MLVLIAVSCFMAFNFFFFKKMMIPHCCWPPQVTLAVEEMGSKFEKK